MSQKNAYLTVCISLCLTLIIAMCLVLIEGTRQNGIRLEAECVTDTAIQSVMAEYHRELMKQYNLFAIDSSYGTSECGTEKVAERLREYLDDNLSYEDIFLSNFLYRDFLGLSVEETKVTGVSFVTDHNGAVFRRCAVDALEDDVGLGLLEQLQEWVRVIEINGLEEGKEAANRQELEKKLQEYDGMLVEVKKGKWEAASVVNPTEALEEKRKLGILKSVTDEDSLSQSVIEDDLLIGTRMQTGEVNVGNMQESDQSGAEVLSERFLFQEYLLRYMGRYGAESEEDVLKYQVEYLLFGNGADIENLRAAVNRICIIREAANAAYLYGNELKRAEIEVLAQVLSSLILLPQIAPVFEAIILLGWAYAESVYDVKILLGGGKVELLKNDLSWHYGLASALTGDLQEQGWGTTGLGYEDYLRVFMMMTDVNLLTTRAMNMVEADIRSTPGNSFFRLDACMEAVELYVKIKSDYGYTEEITKCKRY